MSDHDVERYYVARHGTRWAVIDVLNTEKPHVSIHTTQHDAQAAAETRNAPRREARRRARTPRPAQTALFDDQEVAQ